MPTNEAVTKDHQTTFNRSHQQMSPNESPFNTRLNNKYSNESSNLKFIEDMSRDLVEPSQNKVLIKPKQLAFKKNIINGKKNCILPISYQTAFNGITASKIPE